MCATPRGRPINSSSSRRIPQTARTNISASHSRSTTHALIPIECSSEKNGPIGHR